MPDTEAALPPAVVVDANGNYWRAFDGHYSMCPVSTDNDPVKVVAIYPRLAPSPTDALWKAAKALCDYEEEGVPDFFAWDEKFDALRAALNEDQP